MYSSLIQIIVISDFQCHCQSSLKRVNCVDIAVVDLRDPFHLIKEIISITHLFSVKPINGAKCGVRFNPRCTIL